MTFPKADSDSKGARAAGKAGAAQVANLKSDKD